MRKLELHVFPWNEPAIRLYEQFGFEREGLRKAHYRRGDEYVDAILMALPALGQSSRRSTDATARSAICVSASCGSRVVTPLQRQARQQQAPEHAGRMLDRLPELHRDADRETATSAPVSVGARKLRCEVVEDRRHGDGERGEVRAAARREPASVAPRRPRRRERAVPRPPRSRGARRRAGAACGRGRARG